MTPGVVLTSSGVSLADKLKLNELPLAATPGGKVFCLKALHPSEHTIKSARVPGGNRNSVALCCDMVETFKITEAGSTVSINVVPSILVPASVVIQHGETRSFGNFYNAAFGGKYVPSPAHTSAIPVLEQMLRNISMYRITSQSVTCELIAPALSDQGTITASQFSNPPRTLNNGSVGQPDMAAIDPLPDVYIYQDPPEPSAQILGTSAYTAKCRDGCYMPLKLNSFKWKNMNDRALFENVPTDTMYSVHPMPDIAINEPLTYPYYETRAIAHWAQTIPHPKLCGDNIGLVSFAGMAPNVAIRVRVRQVVEICVRPSTLYSPLVEIALPPDETAIRMYYEISSRMADAYPASYNDLGKLTNIIMGLGKKILPYVEPALDIVSKLPGPAGTVAKVAQKAVPVVSSVVQSIASRKAQKQAAPAQAAAPAPARPKISIVRPTAK